MDKSSTIDMDGGGGEDKSRGGVWWWGRRVVLKIAKAEIWYILYSSST